jgi:hypothetical protein
VGEEVDRLRIGRAEEQRRDLFAADRDPKLVRVHFHGSLERRTIEG